MPVACGTLSKRNSSVRFIPTAKAKSVPFKSSHGQETLFVAIWVEALQEQ